MPATRIPKAPPVETTVAAPYALVTRNGATPGKRPNTFLAYIVGTVPRGMSAGEFRAYIGRNGGTTWTAHPQIVSPDDVVARWKGGWPSPKAIEAVRAKLPVYREES